MADVSIITANGIDYNIKDATARSSIETANGNISSLQSSMEDAQGDISGLETGLGTANGNISDLQDGLTTANGKITALESDMDTAQGDISSLQSGLTTAQGDITSLQSGLSLANGNIAALAGQLSNLKVVPSTNIGYTSGETWLDKVQRAVTQGAIPTGKPFIGVISSGSYFFTAGYLYSYNSQKYGTILFGAYNGLRVYSVSGGNYTETILA